MADSDKNIRITTSKNKTTFPNIVFTGSSAGTSVLTLEVRDDNTVAFTGADGDVFSLDYNLTTGTIWSVNDKSGTPLLRASAGGTIGIAELGASVIVGIGQTNPRYKLDVQGWVGFASTGDGSYTVLVENGLATGNNALSIRAANALRFYNSGNTLYTGFIGAQSGVNTTYTLPTTSPATGTSVLQSTSTGVMSWVPMTAGGGPSGTINSSTVKNIAYYSAATTLSGDSIATGNYFFYDTGNTGLNIANADLEINTASGSTKLLTVGTGATQYAVRKALAVISTNSPWTSGDLLVLGVGNLASSVRFGVDWRGYVTVGTPGTGFTFPITNGTSGQVLTANTNGVASWTTVSGSSGAGSGTVAIPGAQYQVAAYYWSATGASVSGSTTFTNNTSTGVVNITHVTESTSSTTGALTVAGGAGIAKSLFVGTTLSVGQAPGYNVTNNLASFVSTVNTYNQVVIQNKSNGTAASADFVLNNDISTDTTNYGNFGMNSSTFSGSGALGATNAVYVTATSGPLVFGTTTQHPIRFVVNGGTTDTLFIDGAGTAVSVFTNFDLRSQNKIRFFNSGNTFRTELQAGANSASYTLSLPTAPVGVGASVIVTGSDGLQYFAAPGSGIAFSSATDNTPIIRTKRALTIQFCSGYNPFQGGSDNNILTIPESAVDGITQVTYIPRKFSIRSTVATTSPTRIQVERFSGSGVFTYAATGTSILPGFGLTLSSAGLFTTSTTTFAGAFLTSGDSLRLNWTLFNTGHANFSIQLLLEEV